jgi:deoxycytidine triphosphate deaminase
MNEDKIETSKSLISPSATLVQQTGVLHYGDIKTEIDAGRLIDFATADSIQAASYDMRVGTIFRNGRRITDSSPEKQLQLEPGEIVTILTHEELKLPADMIATAFAINTMSSLGFLVLNPGHVDPGYIGPLTVKAINIRKVSFTINIFDKIFTVIFERLSSASPKPYTKRVDRKQKEHDLSDFDNAFSPQSLTQLVFDDGKHQFTTAEDVREKIGNHIARETLRTKLFHEQKWKLKSTRGSMRSAVRDRSYPKLNLSKKLVISLRKQSCHLLLAADRTNKWTFRFVIGAFLVSLLALYYASKSVRSPSVRLTQQPPT